MRDDAPPHDVALSDECPNSATIARAPAAATWLTHLEYDLDSPVWRHWTAFLSGHFRYVRHDERGCGMSDWNIRDLSLERRVLDLETVVEASGLTEPFALLGISEKTVRNHLSHLFDKLGVWSRAQAIVFARERGFTG